MNIVKIYKIIVLDAKKVTISWLAGNLISTILSVCYSFSILKVSLVWVNSQLGKKIVLGEQNLGKADAAEVLWSLAIPFWLLMTLTLFTDISRNVKLLETLVKLQPLKFQEDQRTTAFQRLFGLTLKVFFTCVRKGVWIWDCTTKHCFILKNYLYVCSWKIRETLMACFSFLLWRGRLQG